MEEEPSTHIKTLAEHFYGLTKSFDSKFCNACKQTCVKAAVFAISE